MKREIKFRAWCETDKSMYYPDGIYEFWCDNNSFGFYPRHSNDELYNYNEIAADHEKEIIALQFTGLQDKNGKDIYEGDILKFFSFNQQIVFKQGSFGYMTSDEDYGMFIPLGSNSHYDWEDGQSSKIVIIGNIYENPNLLTTPSGDK